MSQWVTDEEMNHANLYQCSMIEDMNLKLGKRLY